MDLLALEQQRQTLEESLQVLRQSLKHWQLWEAEYEGLKEEIVSAGDEVDAEGLTKIATTYGGDLVNEKETRELTGLNKDSPRSAKSIINLIEHRQAYVQKNIETVQRQFFEAEAKQEELAFAAATQSGASEAGLPLTEIHEELDEDGNVISSSLVRPEETTAKVVESLRQAGLTKDDLDDGPRSRSRPSSEELKPAIVNATPSIPVYSPSVTIDQKAKPEPALPSPLSDGSHDESERPTTRKKSVSFTADTKTSLERPRSISRDGKKSVSFNDKIAVMPAAPPADTRSVSFSAKIEEIPPQLQGPPTPEVQPLSPEDVEKARALMASTEEATDAGATDTSAAVDAMMPENESLEDARLRREMLDYHLNEVGNVVAEMEIDEIGMDFDDEDDTSSYHTSSEYQDDDDTPYTTGLSEDETSEDENGRSKQSQITPEYRKQMEELQQRLIGNLGSAPKDEEIADADPNLDPQDVRRLVIRDKWNSTSSASSESSEKKLGIKKRVSFAQDLDVAEPGSPPLKAQKLDTAETSAPLAEIVSERPSAASTLAVASEAIEKKPSRFMQSRAIPATSSDHDAVAGSAAANTDAHLQNSNTSPLRTTLLERTAESKAAAPSPDDPDTIAQRRELAEAYYSRRNDMIRQQGGFKATAMEEDEDGQLMEETADGRVKKVSRFKAARIRGE